MFLVIVLVTVFDCMMTESHFASDSARISSWMSQPPFSLGLFGVVTTKIVICYHCYFFLTVQASISAACQFQFHSTQELFASFLLEPATPAAHICNRDGQIKGVRAPGRGKEGSPHWHKRQLILMVRIIISSIYRRTLVMEIVWTK